MSDFWAGEMHRDDASQTTYGENFVDYLLSVRPYKEELTDNEFIAHIGPLIVRNRIAPLLRDNLGLNGEEAQSKAFPVAELIKLGDLITADFIALQEGLKEQTDGE